MYRVTRDQLIYAMSPKNSPVLKVEEGATVIFETCDCFENQITSVDTPYNSLDWSRINPATGPVYVEGAEPGDILAVTIERIEIADHGVMLTGPGLGVVGNELEKNQIKLIPIHGEKAVFQEGLELPLNPMIGVIGTAPEMDEISCGTPGLHGGNMDCKIIKEGSTVYLPVNVPGALLAMGDLHAVMGDGEVSVSGVEIQGEVTVQVKVLKSLDWKLPLVRTAESLYTIASELSLDEAVITATKNMIFILETNCKLTKDDAIKLLSIAGNLQICQVVDPLKTVRMELSIHILESLGFQF